jgi:enoyl-CoA hydratase
MDFREIHCERHEQVVVIRFDRPQVRNCVGPRTAVELIEAWGQFRDDPSLHVAVLTGTGPDAFCSGADLKATTELLPANAAEMEEHAQGRRPGYLGPTRWTDINKPIIAAVNGAALAGGLEWACFADIRIAEEHATFGVTCRRWNIGLADGGTVRLPRIVGYARAMELILTGRVIDAAEALRIGLVTEVVPRGQSLARALELAKILAALPQPAMRTDKESVVRGYGLPIDEALRVEAACFNRLLGSPEMAEGIRRFRDRDHPDLRRSGKG